MSIVTIRFHLMVLENSFLQGLNQKNMDNDGNGSTCIPLWIFVLSDNDVLPVHEVSHFLRKAKTAGVKTL